ncbi:L-lactate permease [Rhodopseudomonas boonkerdii]|uniref:L-lactate permease n=1 Tax=Rhodopseudomonas boonkerdii TaxID=475937 RepID=UPI001E4F61CA|nr:L-lactate permease [Rhodopseudomonas boonkerdii]UGV26694.1 L-lactate permease [Rhodopseudomonas boonkerdii]
MLYLAWSLPALAVIGAIASGWAGTLPASLIGLATAFAVAMTTAPHLFSLVDAATALLRGAWIGWIVVPYILGGLLFWQMAIRTGNATMPVEETLRDDRARRRLLFTACYLIGPFAESATGFGIGIMGTMVLIRRLGLKPIELLAFSLISQTMIVWGAMGSGAVVGAAFARMDPTALALRTSGIYMIFNVLWLPIYWRMADRAGIGADWRERISEMLWLVGSLGLAIVATAYLGPEPAMLAAFGPAIVLRYLIDEQPDRTKLIVATRRMLPFTLLIGWLAATRLLPPLSQSLRTTWSIEPFAGAPIWAPLFHAGTWLLVAAILTGVLRGHRRALSSEIGAAWKTGRLAVLTIVIFSMMAELLSSSGIADGLARGMFSTFGVWSVTVTPMISAIFGALANSGNAANGLFMPSQLSLATEAGLDIAAVVALQHAAALSLNMVSPVRMSIVCNLAGTPGHERDAYRAMLPFIVVIIAVLLSLSILIATRII